MDEQIGHYAKFVALDLLVISEKVLILIPQRIRQFSFFEVPELHAAIAAIDLERITRSEPGWAVLYDPEGHHVVLFQAR